MGRRRRKETGRKAPKASEIRRTDQFHRAFVITVAAQRMIAPWAMLVKKSQLET